MVKQEIISNRRIQFLAVQKERDNKYLEENLAFKEEVCTKCKQKLNRGIDWAELSTKDGKYYWNGTPTSEESQGWFPFGLDCIKKIKEVSSVSSQD